MSYYAQTINEMTKGKQCPCFVVANLMITRVYAGLGFVAR